VPKMILKWAARALSGALATAARRRKMGFTDDDTCPCCGQEPEDDLHAHKGCEATGGGLGVEPASCAASRFGGDAGEGHGPDARVTASPCPPLGHGLHPRGRFRQAWYRSSPRRCKSRWTCGARRSSAAGTE